MPKIESRLASLGIELPQVCPPVANYVSSTRSGNIVQISGQLSTQAQGGIKGTIGVDCSLADGITAARLCAINLIAQFKAAAVEMMRAQGAIVGWTATSAQLLAALQAQSQTLPQPG